ncbi:hypothetical protein [Listeria rocourtiae]|uniref:hypothetical protein n=1 Tax=Listeria rocourtiae TaxID=647910 RepID=UPI0003E86F6C|nr:hypothetical protein [Listeria rocourtiae]EUJ47378.1 hypothetical protein PROCOU_09796 [Listeria rocourtiae FSL F6-920]
MGTFLLLIGFFGFFYALIMLILGFFIRGKKIFRPKLNLLILAGTFILFIAGGSMLPTVQTIAKQQSEVKSEEIQKKKEVEKQQAAQKKIKKKNRRKSKRSKKNSKKSRQS